MEPHTSCVCPQSTLSPWSSAVLPHHPPAPPTSGRLTVPFLRGYSTLSLHADRGELPEVLSWQSPGFFSCSSRKKTTSLCGFRFIATKLPEEPAEKVAFHGLAKENQPKRQTKVPSLLSLSYSEDGREEGIERSLQMTWFSPLTAEEVAQRDSGRGQRYSWCSRGETRPEQS